MQYVQVRRQSKTKRIGQVSSRSLLLENSCSISNWGKSSSNLSAVFIKLLEMKNSLNWMDDLCDNKRLMGIIVGKMKFI